MKGGKFDALATAFRLQGALSLMQGFCKTFLQEVAFISEDYARHPSQVLELSWSSFPAAFAAPSRNRE